MTASVPPFPPPLPPLWRAVSLPECVFFQEGPGIRRAQQQVEGIRFINIRCIEEDGTLNSGIMNCIDSQEAFGKYAHFLLETGDCVLSCSGSIGKSAYIEASHLPCVLNTGVIRLRPKIDALRSEYLFYFLNSSLFQEQLKFWATGSAQRNIGPAHLKRMWIALPPLDEQEELCGLLRLLDEHIANERQIRTVLYHTIATLFSAWFSDLEGGDIQPLGELCREVAQGSWGSDTAEKNTAAAYCLRGVDLVDLKHKGHALHAPIRWFSQKTLQKKMLGARHVLVATSGSGPCGHAWWMGEEAIGGFMHPPLFSNFCKRIETASPAHGFFLWCVLEKMRVSGAMQRYINGTSVPNLNIRNLLATHRIAIPETQRLEDFFAHCEALIARLHQASAPHAAATRNLLIQRRISSPSGQKN